MGPMPTCSVCGHPGSQHFEATDKNGYFAFCMFGKCSCFIDDWSDDAEQKTD